jgi:Fe-S-cluster containining protein
MMDDEADGDDDEDNPGVEVHSDCRCGECCRHLIIEAELDDAEGESRIKERGSPIYAPPELTGTGQRELAGYVLNSPDNGFACTFLARSTNLCSIYDTRPWVCRVFDCDREGGEQLVQFGVEPGPTRPVTPPTHAERARGGGCEGHTEASR